VKLRKLLALLLLAWAFGFFWFAVALPQPLKEGASEAVAVPTGGSGRIAHGLALIRAGTAKKLLVSGVDREVKPHEFAVEYGVSPETMACCVSLGFESVDTRSNAAEIAGWMATHGFKTVRLVTSDWHMRRAAFELRQALPDGATVLEDAVPTQPSLRTLFLEYHKLLATWVARLWGD
jgi:uncharacterized SAM-binding protein YcdF (DUF218 family)